MKEKVGMLVPFVVDDEEGAVPVGEETPLAGKGGKESNNAAPNEDEGLKGLIPPNPVC